MSEAAVRRGAIRALKAQLKRAEQRASVDPSAGAGVIAAAREILEMIPSAPEPEPPVDGAVEAEADLARVKLLVDRAADLDVDLLVTLSYFALQRNDVRPKLIALLQAKEEELVGNLESQREK
jgi:hypothetical protein